jgi:CxxC motif-containing protein (DUF1111 family)
MQPEIRATPEMASYRRLPRTRPTSCGLRLLWGLRVGPRYMHDLKSLTLEHAIDRHGGEAKEVRHEFHRLSETEKQQLFLFLNSL